MAAKKSPAVADRRRLCEWPWSEHPPTTPLIAPIPPSLQTQTYWYTLRSSATATTKSRPPATKRCNNAAHQRLQLHRVTVDDASNPTVRPCRFLGDYAIDIQTMHESENQSYRCALRVEKAKIAHAPPPPPPPPGQHWMMLTGLTVYVVYGETGGYSTLSKWISIKHECATIDPLDSKKKPIVFTSSVVQSRGKFFAISLQGTLVVMQMNDHRLKIIGLSDMKAIPCSSWRIFKEY